MKTVQETKQIIVTQLGFIPPFFGPAFNDPMILDNLWYQTQTAYLENPLPHLFKEKIATLLARYCPVPYCLFCHTSTLRPLGMTGADILNLVMMKTPTSDEIRSKVGQFTVGQKVKFPEAGSELEENVLTCVVSIYLNIESDMCHKKLREVLEPPSYNYLILFLAYNKTALTWAEGHPEISYQDDKRVLDNLDEILRQEPEVKTFLDNYRSLFSSAEGQILENSHSEKNKLREIILEKSRIIDEQRALSMHTARMKLLGEMAGSIAHEIKNPLAIALSSLTILSRMENKNTEQGNAQLESMNQTLQRINKTVEGLQFYYGGSQSEEFSRQSLRGIIEKTLPLCQHQLTTNNCSLEWKMPSDDIYLHCLPVAVSQALLNLISNAHDAVRVSDLRWIRMDCKSTGTGVEISITNSGRPISPEIKSKIMIPYFTTKLPNKGTGMGLTIVQKIMDAHSGKVELVDGEETCFRLIFPTLV
jgi:signal transduction histidine kinase